jgi:hypothetical protein
MLQIVGKFTVSFASAHIPANMIRQLSIGNIDIWCTCVKPSILTGFALGSFKR